MAWKTETYSYCTAMPSFELDAWRDELERQVAAKESHYKCRNCGAPPSLNFTLCDYCGFRR